VQAYVKTGADVTRNPGTAKMQHSAREIINAPCSKAISCAGRYADLYDASKTGPTAPEGIINIGMADRVGDARLELRAPYGGLVRQHGQ